MLAYELYRTAKDDIPQTSKFLFKKMFLKDDKVTVDERGLEEYGITKSRKGEQQLQEWLQMPSSTVNQEKMNLPFYRFGAASPLPYLVIYGMMNINKKNKQMTLSVGDEKKKTGYVKHVLDLDSGKVTSKNSENTPMIRLDKVKYTIGSRPLFEEYVKSKIVNKEGMLNLKKYNEFVEKFIKFVMHQKMPEELEIKTGFRVYVLPNNSKIDYKESDKPVTGKKFTDYFGNEATCYPSKTTMSAKFLTYDDPAFTINCKQKDEFYSNLGIGDASLEKVEWYPERIFKISGLDWCFLHPEYEFQDTRMGILGQLHKNYMEISRDKGPKEKTQVRITCMKKQQAKQEILIDENLTMDRMKQMFADVKEPFPPSCLEILIENNGDSVIWTTYLYAVRNFLAGINISRRFLMSYFTKVIKQKQHEWKKNPKDTKDFFSKSDFCLKNLYNVSKNEHDMNEAEMFAHNVGQMAKCYIDDFKTKHGEKDNSMGDILTYSKYDREKLRFVVSRIGRGIQLSKISDTHKEKITKEIRELQLDDEISEDLATNDFSYFFFKGYYSQKEAKTS